MGIAHLTRIDALLYDVAQNASSENYTDWYNSLTTLSREVFFLFNKDEMESNNEKDLACVDAINKFYTDKTVQDKTDARNALIEYELFIKQQLANRKMLMAFSRDVRSAIADVN